MIWTNSLLYLLTIASEVHRGKECYVMSDIDGNRLSCRNKPPNFFGGYPFQDLTLLYYNGVSQIVTTPSVHWGDKPMWYVWYTASGEMLITKAKGINF